MESIGKDCTELKKKYDECFNYWFSEKYLKGDTHSNICEAIFNSYQSCVREAIKKQNIDLKHIEKNVLGTEEEKTKPKMSDIDSKTSTKTRKQVAQTSAINIVNNDELKKIDQEIEELCEQEEELERAILDHIQLLQHRQQIRDSEAIDSDLDRFLCSISENELSTTTSDVQ